MGEDDHGGEHRGGRDDRGHAVGGEHADLGGRVRQIGGDHPGLTADLGEDPAEGAGREIS